MSDTHLEVDGRRRLRARNRDRLLRAASEMFAERGYRRTTTRDVAEAAGITERTLFRHVASKEELFREAVISPVEAFVADFSRTWGERPRGARDTEVEVREFFANLLAVIDSEGHLLQALMAAIAYEPEGPELAQTLSPLLKTLDEIFTVEAELRGWTLEPTVGVRTIVGMALAVSIHGDWLFADVGRPDRTVLVEQLARLTTWGLEGRA